MKIKYGYEYIMLVKKDWVDWWFDDETYNVKEIVKHGLKTEGKINYNLTDMMSGGWPGYLPKRFVAKCDHNLFDAIGKYQIKSHGRPSFPPDEDEIYFDREVKKVEVLDDYFQVSIEMDYK